MNDCIWRVWKKGQHRCKRGGFCGFDGVGDDNSCRDYEPSLKLRHLKSKKRKNKKDA